MTKLIDTKKWTFLKEGVDNGRHGASPNAQKEGFTKRSSSLTPVITGDRRTAKNPVRKAHQSGNRDEENSRLTQSQRQRIKNVEAIEQILKQHPLALYPHLEECLPPEVFEDVVSVLDPEITLVSDDKKETVTDDVSAEQPAVYPVPAKSDEAPVDQTFEVEEAKVINPYRWLPEAEEVDKRDKKSLAEQQRNLLKMEEEQHIKNVTQQFCEWVTSLGGDSNNIEESTITSLFASGYETKPALSVPIHVVELSSVPPELRMSAVPVPPQLQQSTADKKPELGGPTHTANKSQYGAWYLEPKLWKKRPAGEPMQDPDDTKGKELSEAKQRSLQLDYELAPMNGVKLFMDFVEKKDTRRPEFLDHVSDILAQQKSEEQNQDAEPVRHKTSRVNSRDKR